MTGSLNLIQLAQEFSNEDKAREFLESKRWPNGPVCPHCESTVVYRLTPKPDSEKPGRKGLLKCKACRKQFTVTVGTIFSDSHIPLSKWLMAFHLLCASKKGMSAHQLHRMLGMTYKSAWFMAHRIRWAMTQEPVAGKLTGTVEADETYIGGREKGIRGLSKESKKVPVVAMVERSTEGKKGRVRSVVVDRVTVKNIKPVLQAHIAETAHLMTDEHTVYYFMRPIFTDHTTINHKQKEYVRIDGDFKATTNTVESFFALLKRGVHGTYHHWSKKHLGMYLSEFDFRYNSRGETDGHRTVLALKGAEGKRLMLKEPIGK